MHVSISRGRGFTLVEILIVISIIGILTAIMSVSISEARSNARDKARTADIANLQQAIRLYAEENGEYPQYPDGIALGTGGAIDAEIGSYLSKIPTDPLQGDGVHAYWYDSDWECDGRYFVVLIAVETETGSITNYTDECGPLAGMESKPKFAFSRPNIFTVPTAEAYLQSSYYSQSYYQSYYQNSYYTQANYYSQAYYEGYYESYYEGYYEGYYQGAYGGGSTDITPGERPYIVIID